jgi:hypothetical protein
MQEKIREPKVSRLFPNVCDFQKENQTLGYGFKIYRKSLAEPMDFYSISEA